MSELELLKAKLAWTKELSLKIDKILNAELDIEDYSSEIFFEINKIENKIDDLEFELEMDSED